MTAISGPARVACPKWSRARRLTFLPAGDDALKDESRAVLDETFRQTVTAVAVPPNRPLALAFATRFLTEATSNRTLRTAYDDNGPKEHPIRTK